MFKLIYDYLDDAIMVLLISTAIAGIVFMITHW